MLMADVATQGWAVATATEAYLLLETGQIDEAQQLLAFEIPKFKNIAFEWSDALVADEPQLATAYRFASRACLTALWVASLADIGNRERKYGGNASIVNVFAILFYFYLYVLIFKYLDEIKPF